MTDTPPEDTPVADNAQAVVDAVKTLVASIQQAVNDLQTKVEQAVSEIQTKLDGLRS